MSVRSNWECAEDLRKQFSTTNDQLILDRAVKAWLTTKHLIEKLAMFSENETLDDLITTEIRYISASYYLGHLLQQKYTGSRVDNLKRASQSYKEFLSMCKSYTMVSSADVSSVTSILEEKNKSSDMPTSSAELRQQKIQRFKRDKELEASIAILSGNTRMDEDEARSLSLLDINLKVSKVVEEIKFIEKELTILASENERYGQMERQKQLVDRKEDSSTWRLDRTSQVLSPNGKVLTPFVITSQRQTASAAIFGSDHSLPTMTIDEYLDNERKQGGMLSSTNPQHTPDTSILEDNDDTQERERQKAIYWDSFKEENPKGIGNTMNRG
ncbi:TAP42 family protein [Taphrina deformans PYCC 5710]|uniref:TAP42 family protein n=1 Tax=Taphrina deformans (strain PYCC 5710 / ATCC 11124 / CBS 356.35 / IMI 108563 / JCM 9778 / NBRC 8474) TaxID=1097556 RepID=R4XC00_TAPDE|nr:TAP42 family protein [Taphrina deformans PYCC 5710]|eukprot:CCG81906.1 TAP42 family protein [Taphrina deformans PYCC 5710]